MKLFTSSLFIFLITISLANSIAQPRWVYIDKISFSGADTSWGYPYLCAVDQNGRLYVASSKISNLAYHNAIYYADSNDVILKKLIDYDLNGDSDTLTGNIGFIRGIATLQNDVIINASVPFQRSKPNTVASQYYYKNGDTSQVQKFGFYHTGSGYGTYLNGLAFSKDSIAFCGISYQTSVRCYNFTQSITSPVRGSYIPPATYGQEIGGHDGTGVSTIRDVAVQPLGDYNNTETPWYTTRNSNPPIIGGIGLWAGATQTNPGAYTCQRVSDFLGLLNLDRSIPYGITVDKFNNLWVAGTDTTRRWVKAFMMLGTFASELYELPAQFSMTNPDPNGAPFTLPADVALTQDGLTAYVTDAGTRAVYRFKYTEPVNVRDDAQKPIAFALEQNYPNPFNPSTMISYSLPKEMNIKLLVTNSIGQQVAVLLDGIQSAGKHIQIFDAKNLPSGIYYYTLVTGSKTISKKMLLMK